MCVCVGGGGCCYVLLQRTVFASYWLFVGSSRRFTSAVYGMADFARSYGAVTGGNVSTKNRNIFIVVALLITAVMITHAAIGSGIISVRLR